LRVESRKITRLAPPASDTPGGSPVGAGIGAVAQRPWKEAGRRRRISPTFHGPVMIIAKVPSANCW
jgi:hypothetical protein